MTENMRKMLAGEPYIFDSELAAMSDKAYDLCQEYNITRSTDTELRERITSELVPNKGNGCMLVGPIYFDFGEFITLGDNFYANYNLTILDEAGVTIGNNTICGPNVTIATAMHDMDYIKRRGRREGANFIMEEYAKPVRIGDDCWIASGAIICPGVTIGDRCVIGAGSVVTRDIESDMFAAGNPCRSIRKIGSNEA